MLAQFVLYMYKLITHFKRNLPALVNRSFTRSLAVEIKVCVYIHHTTASYGDCKFNQGKVRSTTFKLR